MTEQKKVEERWDVQVDGSSTKGESGLEIVIFPPQDKKLMYIIRLTFPTSNNEAKYDALISGLRIAFDM